MDADKFFWMLDHNALYFCRSDLFEDPLEGHFPKGNASAEDWFVEHQIKNGGFGACDGTSDAALREGYRMMIKAPDTDRKNLFVSCWHMNQFESPEMWEKYTKTDESVCVQTSFETLWDLLPSDSFLGGVSYIDHQISTMDPTNSLYPIAHKDRKYACEREVRAVIWAHAETRTRLNQKSEDSLHVPIDLNLLISAVHLHPSSSTVFAKEIGDRLGKMSSRIFKKYKLA